MIERLEAVQARYNELTELVFDPGLSKDPKRYKDVMRERAHLEELVAAFADYKKLLSDLDGARTIVKEEADPELRDMAREELKELESTKDALEERVNFLLIPRDPLDDKNTIVEIRAGTGGEEAALFAADLYRMYSRYADALRWKIEVMSASESGMGGFKEII